MFIKILGSIIVITCGLVFGASQRAKFKGRIKTIKGIMRAIDFMHSEISCMCTPTGELIDKLCQSSTGNVRCFFKECRSRHIKRKDLPFSEIWSKTVKNAEYLELDRNAEETLLEIGNALGRYEADEQMRVILNARKSFERFLKCAEEASERLGKLYGNLSLISGIATVIILF